MSLHNHQTDVFFDINGIEVSPIQLHILTCMLDDTPDHEWCLSEVQQPGTREALDWLVLEGVIERYKDPACWPSVDIFFPTFFLTSWAIWVIFRV